MYEYGVINETSDSGYNLLCVEFERVYKNYTRISRRIENFDNAVSVYKFGKDTVRISDDYDINAVIIDSTVNLDDFVNEFKQRYGKQFRMVRSR